LNVQKIINHQAKFPGIDYDIGLGNVLGDEELFKEIILMFYEDHSDDINKVQKAILQRDRDNCKRLVHTFKGVVCSIGAMTLFEKVKQLDIAINENNESEYQSLFDVVKPEFEKVIQGIETILPDKV
jgi:HPt (histidine-containing phosphotransfer) domain-containing protein